MSEPAFPIPLHSEKCSCPCGNTGMTLVDYFAAHATDGDIAAILLHCGGNITRQQARYIHAAEMLEARNV